jgi:hypothetical protein
MAPYRDRRRKATLPNALSVLALLCGLGVLWCGVFEEDMPSALAFMTVGGALCVLDGMIADWLNEHTELGDKQLQPLAGLALGGASVLALVWTGHWSLWLAIVLGVIMAALQFISFFSKWMPRVKRHQFWVHPIFAITVFYAAIVSTWAVVLPDRYDVAIYATAVSGGLGLIILRWDRYREWFAGPQ